MIGNVSIDRALCDLGSSLSLMPYTIFKRLGLRELSHTSISIRLADHSIKYSSGILEDVQTVSYLYGLIRHLGIILRN